ncbi:Rieske (2Fe-2S) protein [Sulfolobus acidocaldarius]|uniref:Conserved protein n=4 Tax=Sulfolobus acidocaldarius TaxID=2285 RepID=Q4JC32_SULAC|nr:Rieske 2Fe-2S domain-containing protein [Sulfolobus acidocaldarius]AAY79647.1 conserved protein [Sulfolobus acidocaldarius DSM 639]AGE70202.1 hypothetical protein SacN8_01105 [Sulfolobus acidocaldarius N8]AGE72477.1 hypothetical protein SacRon12I_01105 [Sulfolobus acidocaldarius Ron12/I]ALU29389.1 (2Fe-2S)-binding protein [Sulfolobus acidocaldarius]ALU32118.1 (2Fe-2S)-binding protein [Sulfolobus acidocaldarius]
MSIEVKEIEGYPIMIYRKDGKTYTWLAGCPHKRRPILEKGVEIFDDKIKCPFHYAVFSLITGEMLKEPESKTSCGSNCRLIQVKITDKLEFSGEPFIPTLPSKKG